MFTIKHITPLGNEAILAAEEVTFMSNGSCQDAGHDHEPFHGTVFYIPTAPKASDSTIIQLHGGTVYVMNRFGSTVAKYELGGWMTSGDAAGVSKPMGLAA